MAISVTNAKRFILNFNKFHQGGQIVKPILSLNDLVDPIKFEVFVVKALKTREGHGMCSP